MPEKEARAPQEGDMLTDGNGHRWFIRSIEPLSSGENLIYSLSKDPNIVEVYTIKISLYRKMLFKPGAMDRVGGWIESRDGPAKPKPPLPRP